MEENFGFDAYGLSNDMPDPVARSIRSMLDHMHLVDQRLNVMCQAMKKMDSSYQLEDIPELKNADLGCFNQEEK